MNEDKPHVDPAAAKRWGRAAAAPPPPLLALALLLLLLAPPPSVGAVDVIASSRLESCVEDGSAVSGFGGGTFWDRGRWRRL
jgi:hypothetical protein